MTIKSKIHTYGNEKEASWPPKFPKRGNSGLSYWDSKTQSFKEGRPPNPNNQFGVAPIAIFDSMPATYHEGAKRMVESRHEWARLDKETGSLTFSSLKEPKKYVEKGKNEYEKELKKDRRKASEEAIKMVRANPRHIHQKVQKQAENQEKIAKESGLSKLIKEAEKSI